jgi:hypothetical protein
MERDDNVTLTPTEKTPAEINATSAKEPETTTTTEVINYCTLRIDSLLPRVRRTSALMRALHQSVVGA